MRAPRGLVVSAWEPAFNAYLSGAVADDERARAYGDFNYLRGLICFPAPILGALLFESFGFHAPILGGLAIILIVIVIMTKLPEQR